MIQITALFGTELQICRVPTHTRVNAFLHGRRRTVPSPTQLFFLSRPTVAASRINRNGRVISRCCVRDVRCSVVFFSVVVLMCAYKTKPPRLIGFFFWFVPWCRCPPFYLWWRKRTSATRYFPKSRRVPRSFKLSVRRHCLLYSSPWTHTVRPSVSTCRLYFARPTTRYRYCRHLRHTVPQPTPSVC